MTFNVNIFVNVLLTFIHKTTELRICSHLWFAGSQDADFSLLAKFLQKQFTNQQIPMEVQFELHVNRISKILSPLLGDHSIFFKNSKNKILGSYTGTGSHYILVNIVGDNQISIEFSRSPMTTTPKRTLPEPQAKPTLPDTKQDSQPGPSSQHATINNDVPSPINPPAMIEDLKVTDTSNTDSDADHPPSHKRKKLTKKISKKQPTAQADLTDVPNSDSEVNDSPKPKKKIAKTTSTPPEDRSFFDVDTEEMNTNDDDDDDDDDDDSDCSTIKFENSKKKMEHQIKKETKLLNHKHASFEAVQASYDNLASLFQNIQLHGQISTERLSNLRSKSEKIEEKMNRKMAEKIKQHNTAIKKLNKEISELDEFTDVLKTLKNAVRTNDGKCSSCPLHCVEGLLKLVKPPKKNLKRKAATNKKK